MDYLFQLTPTLLSHYVERFYTTSAFGTFIAISRIILTRLFIFHHGINIRFVVGDFKCRDPRCYNEVRDDTCFDSGNDENKRFATVETCASDSHKVVFKRYSISPGNSVFYIATSDMSIVVTREVEDHRGEYQYYVG